MARLNTLPTSPDITHTPTPEPTASSSLVVADPGGLLAHKPTTDIPVPMTGGGRLFFFHPSSSGSDAQAARAATPSPSLGQAFLIVEGEAHPLPQDWRYTILRCAYWYGNFDLAGNITQGPRKDKQAGDYSFCETVTIVDAFGQLYALCQPWSKTFSGAGLRHWREVNTSATPEWVTAAPTEDMRKTRAAIVAATGPAVAFRSWSHLSIRTTKSANGNPYAIGTARPEDATPALLQRVGEWLEADGMDAIAAAIEQYQAKLAELGITE